MIVKFLILVSAGLDILQNSFKRDFTERKASPYIPMSLPWVIGGVAIIPILFVFDLFVLPGQSEFYYSHLGACVFYAFGSYLVYVGLTKTNFALASAVLATGVIFQSIMAFVLLGESFNPTQWFCFAVVILVIIKLNFASFKTLKFDLGIVQVTVGVFLLSLAAVLFKNGAIHNDSFWSFASGRAFLDILGHGALQLLIPFVDHRSLKENYTLFLV